MIGIILTFGEKTLFSLLETLIMTEIEAGKDYVIVERETVKIVIKENVPEIGFYSIKLNKIVLDKELTKNKRYYYEVLFHEICHKIMRKKYQLYYENEEILCDLYSLVKTGSNSFLKKLSETSNTLFGELFFYMILNEKHPPIMSRLIITEKFKKGELPEVITKDTIAKWLGIKIEKIKEGSINIKLPAEK
jgi:hypothetical protein